MDVFPNETTPFSISLDAIVNSSLRLITQIKYRYSFWR